MWTVVFSVLVLCHLHCATGAIPVHTQQYICQLLKVFEEQRIGAVIINPQAPNVGDRNLHSEDFFLPSIIIWSPYITYPCLFPPGSISCPSCGSPTRHSYWNDGSSSSLQPRLIHDMDNIVYLISAVYSCENRHKVLAHDESVLNLFPSPSMIPFVLLRRTGMTSSLANICTSLTVQGMNFHNMETLLIQRRWTIFAKQCDILNEHEKLMTGMYKSNLDFWASSLSQTPSDYILKQCFLAMFLRNEQIYLRELISIKPGNSISFDHTFKVAANIGYVREDGKWVPQYDSLFLVMNEDGKIVTWQLTMGTSFSQIEVLLKDLKERSNITTIYIDDCCKLRGKIQSVLGKECSVKLDLFHATQRITKTLCKRCKLASLCMNDLTLVFRANGDSGDSRLCMTPQPDQMLSQMQNFVEKWKDTSDCHGVNVFTTDTIPAIENLKRHISYGCISNIPPGAGTNRNERFHHHINSMFHRSKIGILLAYALLNVIIHAHNLSEKKLSRVVTQPITASKHRKQHDEQVTVEKIKPVGILPKERDKDFNNSDHWEIDVSQSVIDLELIAMVYKESLRKFQVLRSVSAMGLSRLKQSVIHFAPFHPDPGSTTNLLDINATLRKTLHDNALQFTQVDGDGNCFFTAIALNMVSNQSQWTQTLRMAGWTDGADVNTQNISPLLRQAYVKELLGDRRHQYEAFVSDTDIDYVSEAQKFLDPAFYDSVLGDTMPLALSTALQFSIVIFSTDSRRPVMYVTPDITATDATAFLVYNPDGKGHYDAAVPCHQQKEVQSPSSAFVSTSCKCGVNKQASSITRASCKSSPFYRTRCKCFKKDKPCTSLCRCFNCENPCGTRPIPSNIKTRVNRKHALEAVDVPNSKRFAEQRKETISMGVWSDFESIILNQIISLSSFEDMESVDKLYNDIVDYSSASYCTVPLPPGIVFTKKNKKQISSKIEHSKAHSYAT